MSDWGRGGWGGGGGGWDGCGGGWGGGGWSSSSWGGGRSGGGWGESGSSRGRSRGARRGAGSPGSPPTPPYPQSRRRAGGGLSPQRGSNSHAPLPKGQGDRPRTTGAETHTQAQPSQIYLGLPLYLIMGWDNVRMNRCRLCDGCWVGVVGVGVGWDGPVGRREVGLGRSLWWHGVWWGAVQNKRGPWRARSCRRPRRGATLSPSLCRP